MFMIPPNHSPRGLICTNTSGLNIDDIAAVLKDPSRVPWQWEHVGTNGNQNVGSSAMWGKSWSLQIYQHLWLKYHVPLVVCGRVYPIFRQTHVWHKLGWNHGLSNYIDVKRIVHQFQEKPWTNMSTIGAKNPMFAYISMIFHIWCLGFFL